MNKTVYKHLLATYGRNPALWVGYFCALIQTFIIRIYVVIVMAQIATNIAAGDLQEAKRHTLYFLISYTIGAIIGTLGELLSIKTENMQYQKLMIAYHKKLTGKDMPFYRDNQTGYLASVFRQYLDSAMLLTRFWRDEAMGTVMSLTLPAVVLLIASPKIGLVAVGIILVQLVYIVWTSAKANKYRVLAHEIYRKITGEVSDEITNIVAFKSGGVEKAAYKTIADLASQETSAFWLRRKTTSLLDVPRNIITALGISLAVYLIIASAGENKPASLGLIVLTLTYMFQIVRNISTLPVLVANHDDLITKLYPALHYLGTDYELIRDPKNPRELVISSGAVDLKNVSFSYPSHSDKAVSIPEFSGLNIHINGGEQLGVVGLSGAGKSTLANLLLRFDEVQDGSITIDGIDIREVSQSQLRQKIAYVPQEPLLFHRSIKQNIAYYNDTATLDDITRAAKAAHAHEFISKLPDGYDTTVGERGVKLSGGQKQRVAIARAILKKAPIMIFDEATSALDSESEEIIQNALPQILGKQTAIVVAHRLSTVAGLDRIIVMQSGEIIEEGTHKQLLSQKGRYYTLWQKQIKSSSKS